MAVDGAGPTNGAQPNMDEPWSVESVLATLTASYAENTDSPIAYFHLLERLKTTERAGWLRFGLENPESIADHMYRMSHIVDMAPEALAAKLDIPRCRRMALVHDVAEALVGDITPVDPVSKPEKSRRESTTMDYICGNLLGAYDGGNHGRKMRELWQEYEDSKTPESLFVHDVDKIELLLQMQEYERSNKCERDLGEFTWVAQKIQGDELRGWAADIFRERQAMWKKHGKTPSWAADTEPEPKA
jgi:putative hydrolase of HD superfamily